MRLTSAGCRRATSPSTKNVARARPGEEIEHTPTSPRRCSGRWSQSTPRSGRQSSWNHSSTSIVSAWPCMRAGTPHFAQLVIGRRTATENRVPLARPTTSWSSAAGRRARSPPRCSPRPATACWCSSASAFRATTSASRCSRRRCRSSSASACCRHRAPPASSASPAARSSGAAGEPWSFWFREDPGGYTHAYQVVRAEFDEILLRHAARTAPRCAKVHGRPASTARARSASARSTTARARVRGRARHRRERPEGAPRPAREPPRFNAFFKNLAIFGYFADAGRLRASSRTTSSPPRSPTAGSGTSRSTTAP